MVKRTTAHGALILGVVLIALTAATLATALAAIGAGALPRAAVQRVAATKASDTSITVTGSMPLQNVARADAALRGLISTTLAPYPFLVERAEIGRALNLAKGFGQPHTDQGQTTVIVPAAVDSVGTHATLVAGTWPGAAQSGRPLDAALPDTVARLLALPVGATLASADSFSETPVELRVAGIFHETDPDSPYWKFTAIGSTGVSVNGDITSYGPLIVDSTAVSGGRLKLDSASWVIRPDLSRVSGGDIRPLANRVARLQTSIVQSPQLVSVTVTTVLPQTLAAAAGDATAARSALAVAAALSALLALAALVLAARLLRMRRELETATLRARGGTSGQLVALSGVEALTCGLVAAAGGVYGGVALARALAPAAMPHGAPSLTVWLAALVVALVSAAILAGAALAASSPLEAWAKRSRGPGLMIARVGADIAVVALAAVAVWQLRELTLASATGGVDPVLVVAPALAVAGAALLLIRLVPWAGRLGERLARRRRGLVGPLVTWEVSRNPARFAGVVLLSVLAVTCGTFALSMHASWHRSQIDQAAFDTGSDVRVDQLTTDPNSAAAIGGAQGVTIATPFVFIPQASGAAVAVNAASASAIELRSDLSPTPAAQLWQSIEPTADQGLGLTLPGTPVRVALTMSVRTTPADSPPLGVQFTVLDADGVAYQIAADDLPADGQPHIISGLISMSARAVYPLRLAGVTFSGSFSATALTLDGASTAGTATGPLVPFVSGDKFIRWWRGAAASGSSVPDSVACAVQSATCDWPSRPALDQFTLAGSPPVAVISGIATTSFMTANGVKPGDTVPLSVNGVDITVRLSAQISALPTLGGLPVVVVDLATLQNAVLASVSPPLNVHEWLLRTRDGTPPTGLPSTATVTSRAAEQSALLDDPLASPAQRMWVVIAVAAAVLAVLGGAVNVAAELRTRRRDTALLAALGVSRWQQLRGLCLERLALGSASAGLGLLLGAGLSAVLVAPLTPSAAGTTPVPPVLVTYVWPWSAALAAAVALGPVAALALGTLRRPDAAAELRLAEAI